MYRSNQGKKLKLPPYVVVLADRAANALDLENPPESPFPKGGLKRNTPLSQWHWAIPINLCQDLTARSSASFVRISSFRDVIFRKTYIVPMRLHGKFLEWVLLSANQSSHSPYARDRNFSEDSTITQASYQTLGTTSRPYPLSPLLVHSVF
jgi:hypothetical protein